MSTNMGVGRPLPGIVYFQNTVVGNLPTVGKLSASSFQIAQTAPALAPTAPEVYAPLPINSYQRDWKKGSDNKEVQLRIQRDVWWYLTSGEGQKNVTTVIQRLADQITGLLYAALEQEQYFSEVMQVLRGKLPAALLSKLGLGQAGSDFLRFAPVALLGTLPQNLKLQLSDPKALVAAQKSLTTLSAEWADRLSRLFTSPDKLGGLEGKAESDPFNNMTDALVEAFVTTQYSRAAGNLKTKRTRKACGIGQRRNSVQTMGAEHAWLE